MTSQHGVLSIMCSYKQKGTQGRLVACGDSGAQGEAGMLIYSLITCLLASQPQNPGTQLEECGTDEHSDRKA